jgi:hypothetical protein
MQDFRNKRKELIDAVNEMKMLGKYTETAERDYKREYRKEFFRLHIEDKVAWTACADLAKGEEKVSELRYKRGIYKSGYETALEKINVLKLEIRIMEDEIKREWRG